MQFITVKMCSGKEGVLVIDSIVGVMPSDGPDLKNADLCHVYTGSSDVPFIIAESVKSFVERLKDTCRKTALPSAFLRG